MLLITLNKGSSRYNEKGRDIHLDPKLGELMDLSFFEVLTDRPCHLEHVDRTVS